MFYDVGLWDLFSYSFMLTDTVLYGHWATKCHKKICAAILRLKLGTLGLTFWLSFDKVTRLTLSRCLTRLSVLSGSAKRNAFPFHASRRDPGLIMPQAEKHAQPHRDSLLRHLDYYSSAHPTELSEIVIIRMICLFHLSKLTFIFKSHWAKIFTFSYSI